MLISQFLLSTLRETPTDAQLISHQLMLRAGLIRKLASGLYTWLPLGICILRKVESVVREEMNASGALEILMPVVQSAEIWQESERWDQYGYELLKFKDRHDRAFCFGPTHEEIATDIARRELSSYKQLPLILYQIQTKFRDEIRPRFGVIRSREFIMKDAYSFDLNEEGVKKSYHIMFDTYHRIFKRLGLNFRAVLADTGSIGGDYSHEFQALADGGEDMIAYSDGSDYAANLEKAEAYIDDDTDLIESPLAPILKIATPNIRTIEDLSKHLQVPTEKMVKTLIVEGNDNKLIAIVLRGDHELNFIKAENLLEIAKPLRFANEYDVKKVVGCEIGFIGPVQLNIPIIVDREAAQLSNFVCGSNQNDFHFMNVNWKRDAVIKRIGNLRNVMEGETSPDGKGKLIFTRGIEVGQTFRLYERYSKKMNAVVKDQWGKRVTLKMGCYGIGISRVVAAIVEQHHDKHGIVWPIIVAPFQIVLIPIRLQQSVVVRQACEALYAKLNAEGYEVLFDDRQERPGVKFSDMDLIGIPHQLIVSDRGLNNGNIEYKNRKTNKIEVLPVDKVLEHFKNLIS